MPLHYDHLSLKDNLQRSLRASLWDGVAWSLTVGFAEIFFAPFAVFLGAANVVLGLLSTLPQVVGDFCQLGTAALVRAAGSRKRLVLWGTAGQVLFLAGMASVVFWTDHRLAGLMVFSILYWAAWMVLLPAWQSWMGDLVPSERRGRFFGLRSKWVQVASFGALVCGGLILQKSQSNAVAKGFIVLFALGIAGRLLSFAFLNRQDDVAEASSPPDAFPFRRFLGELRRTNFGRFVLFVSLFAAAMNVSGTYFVPFALEELGLDYLRFMILLALMFGTKFLTLPVWGHLSDRYGSRRLFALACSLSALLPFLLLVSRNFYYLCLVQLIGGLAIGGFELCSFNFLLDSTEPAHRTRAAAYYQVLTGLGIVCGAIGGGFLLKNAPWGFNAFMTIFLVSGTLRAVLSATLLPSVREVRAVPHVTYRELLGRLARFQKSVAE